MSKVDGKQLIELKRIVFSTFNKSDWIELGYLLNSIETIERHPRLLRSLDFGDDDYEGNILDVLNKLLEKSPNNLSIIYDFIKDKKESNINSELFSTYSERKQDKTLIMTPNPEIFKIPDKQPDNNLVSVMMPFHSEMDRTINSIKNVCTNLGIGCKRADDIWDNSTIIQDIFELIYVSEVVIADFTGKNPNVFYEVGIAHTLGKTVIPISQSINDIPADLRHHRVLKYQANGEGYILLETELDKKLKGLFSNKKYS